MTDEAIQSTPAPEPSEDDLVSEFADSVNAGESPADAGITQEAVAGEKAKAPTLPDSSALRDKLNALTAPAAPAPQESPENAELAALRQAVTQLSQIQHQQATGLTPAQILQQQNTPEALAKNAMAEARKARENAEAYRERMEELESRREIQALRSGLTTFVQTNKDAAPLTATAEDSADLVLSVMQENPEYSESQRSEERRVGKECRSRGAPAQ